MGSLRTSRRWTPWSVRSRGEAREKLGSCAERSWGEAGERRAGDLESLKGEAGEKLERNLGEAWKI
jgi:hypothetical protein